MGNTLSAFGPAHHLVEKLTSSNQQLEGRRELGPHQRRNGKGTSKSEVSDAVREKKQHHSLEEHPELRTLGDLNTKVRSTCVDHDVLFVDNDVNFTFMNGTVDDAAFQRDGIHLSESGTDRLLRHLNLSKRL